MHNETPPLTPTEAARMLNVDRSTIYRLVGIEWVEYQAAGARPIRRITVESVRRLLERRRDQ
jgi:hypothetical protein